MKVRCGGCESPSYTTPVIFKLNRNQNRKFEPLLITLFQLPYFPTIFLVISFLLLQMLIAPNPNTRAPSHYHVYNQEFQCLDFHN